MAESPLERLNKILQKNGINIRLGTARQARFRYYRHKGDNYAFCWTTERTTFKANKPGFYAFIYRINKDGTWKIKKAVRFGKRKVAKSRAGTWYEARRTVLKGTS